MDDGQLLQDYSQHGSEAAFAELMKRHLDLVYSVALRRLGSPQAADDVTQSVFCLLAQKAGRLPSGTVLEGWLYQTTWFMAARYQEKEWRRRHREREAVSMNATNSNDAGQDLWGNIAPLLDGAMQELKDPEREAVLMRFFKKKTWQEIGLALGMSEDAARMRTQRSLEKLRELLLARGIPCTTLALGTVLMEKAIEATPVTVSLTISQMVLKSLKTARVSMSFSADPPRTLRFSMKTIFLVGIAVLLTFTSSLYVYNHLQNQSKAGPAAGLPPAMLRSGKPAAGNPKFPRWSGSPRAGTMTRAANAISSESTNIPPEQVTIELKWVEIPQSNNHAWDLGGYLNNTSKAGESSNQGQGAPLLSATPPHSYNNPRLAASVPVTNHAPAAAIPSAEDQEPPTGVTAVKSKMKVSGILTEAQSRVLLRSLEQQYEIDVATHSRVTTISGQQAQVAIFLQLPKQSLSRGGSFTTNHLEGDNTLGPSPGIGQMPHETGPQPRQPDDPNSMLPSDKTTPQSKMTVDVLPEVLEDGRLINMLIICSAIDVMDAAKSVPQEPTRFVPFGAATSRGDIQAPLALPRLLVDQVSRSTITLSDGQTAVLTEPLQETRSDAEAAVKLQRILFVTPTIVDPAGNRVRHEDEGLSPAPQSLNGGECD